MEVHARPSVEPGLTCWPTAQALVETGVPQGGLRAGLWVWRSASALQGPPGRALLSLQRPMPVVPCMGHQASR